MAILLVATSAHASEIADFYLDLEGGRLKVSFQVKDDLKGMEDSLKAGVPLLYHFSLTLYRAKAFFPDPKVLKVRFRHRLLYDNLKGVFTVLREEEGKTLTFDDPEEARASMGKVRVDLGGLDRFPEGRYRLKLKVKMGFKRPLLWPLAILKPLLGRGGRTVQYRCEFTLSRPLIAGSP